MTAQVEDSRTAEAFPGDVTGLGAAAFLRFGVALCICALLSCAFAPFHWWPLAILCPAALMALWARATARRAAALGFWFGFGTMAAGTYWLYHAIYLDAPIWLALLAALGLMGLMAAYHALTGYVAVRFLQPGPVRWLLGTPAVWLLSEWLRGWPGSGFAWLSLGYSQTGTVLANLAPLAGLYGISLVLLMSAGALVTLMRGTKRARIIAAAVLGVPWLAAALLRNIAWTHRSGAAVSVAIVQANIP